MNTDKTLLFIGAHPDDETFGPGATLAHYASRGVNVYYVCATGGESGTVNAIYLQEYASVKHLRHTELKCAAEELGLSGLYFLGYRDSGMPGSPDNNHPQSLNMALLSNVVSNLVRIIRDIKPQVVLTHGPHGDYGHPDHIMVHKATITAFKAAGDISLYPDCGQPFQPQKLYYNTFSHRMLKLMIKFMPLLGRNPRRFGRNHDIDLTAIVNQTMPVTTVIKLDRRALKRQRRAASCHQSQIEGTSLRRLATAILNRFGKQEEFFTLALPSRYDQFPENDLFQGIKILNPDPWETKE